MLKGKRGQGLSTNAIILIVLGIIILVVLIVGFTAGWNRLAPWISPSNNVNDIVEGCSLACVSNNEYDFCSFERTLKAEDLPNNLNEAEGTCTFFATESGYEIYGVEDCPGLC